MNKKIILVDASSLNSSGCLRKFVLHNVLGYRTKGLVDASMHYGSAFHIFREVLKKYKDPTLAQLCAQRFFKSETPVYTKSNGFLTLFHLAETIETYLQLPPDNLITLVDKQGVPLVEQTVSIPFYQDEYCEVLLQGTIDDLGQIVNGCYLIEDIKTTTSWNIKEYFEGYELSHQLMFYLLIVKWLAKHKPDSVFAEMIHHRVGCSIYGVFLAKDKPTHFERSRVMFFSEEQMDEFELMVRKFIIRVVASVQDLPQLPYREGILTQTCHGRFPGRPCEYSKVCSAVDEITGGHILNNVFDIRPYNPLGFRSIPKEIEELITKYKEIKQ